MPATVPAVSVVVTKNSASGNFQFLIHGPNPTGAVRFCFALLSADMATAAALAGGASATFNYTQDGTLITGGVGPNRSDYPISYAQETF